MVCDGHVYMIVEHAQEYLDVIRKIWLYLTIDGVTDGMKICSAICRRIVCVEIMAFHPASAVQYPCVKCDGISCIVGVYRFPSYLKKIPRFIKLESFGGDFDVVDVWNPFVFQNDWQSNHLMIVGSGGNYRHTDNSEYVVSR